jgi:CheY-like chemotaxis protein
MGGLLRNQLDKDANWAARTDADRAGEGRGQPSRSLRILLVEDHPDVAASTALLLEYFGHDVSVAPDGRAALELARLSPPDVALLDIGLPIMDGCEVARQLVGLCRENKPALIAVSGYGGEEQARRCADAGIELLLLKPVDPEELRLMLLTLPKHVTPSE